MHKRSILPDNNKRRLGSTCAVFSQLPARYICVYASLSECFATQPMKKLPTVTNVCQPFHFWQNVFCSAF